MQKVWKKGNSLFFASRQGIKHNLTCVFNVIDYI